MVTQDKLIESKSASRHLVDPQLLSMLDVFPTVAISADILPAMRARTALFPVDPADVERCDLTIRNVPGPKNVPDIELWIYRPHRPERALPCIFHIHGGGYVAGNASDMEATHRPLAADLGCCIISVNYRLAPETPHPGAIEDCYAALAWLFQNAGELGVDPSRVGIMGESAGGGLAAALALLVRDRKEYSIIFQHLIYAMLDDRTCTKSDPNPYVGEFIWTRHNNHFGWSSLLGCAPGSDALSYYAAPARAEDLSGLPPTFISIGSLDLFLEENLEYGRRLLCSGVPVELHVYPGAFHAFNFSPNADIAVSARRDSREALAKMFELQECF